jgi:hypothetical protein
VILSGSVFIPSRRALRSEFGQKESNQGFCLIVKIFSAMFMGFFHSYILLRAAKQEMA